MSVSTPGTSNNLFQNEKDPRLHRTSTWVHISGYNATETIPIVSKPNPGTKSDRRTTRVTSKKASSRKHQVKNIANLSPESKDLIDEVIISNALANIIAVGIILCVVLIIGGLLNSLIG